MARNHCCACALTDITKRVIRDVTGNKEYEFGDGSKAVSAATQDAAEKAAEAVIDAGGSAIEAGAAAKKVLDDSGYQVCVRVSNGDGGAHGSRFICSCVCRPRLLRIVSRSLAI